MEITRREFDEGEVKTDDGLETEILTFLKMNKEKAFVKYKIAAAIDIQISERSWWEAFYEMWRVSRALRKLEVEGRIIRKTISGGDYYIIS